MEEELDSPLMTPELDAGGAGAKFHVNLPRSIEHPLDHHQKKQEEEYQHLRYRETLKVSRGQSLSMRLSSNTSVEEQVKDQDTEE